MFLPYFAIFVDWAYAPNTNLQSKLLPRTFEIKISSIIFIERLFVKANKFSKSETSTVQNRATAKFSADVRIWMSDYDIVEQGIKQE